VLHCKTLYICFMEKGTKSVMLNLRIDEALKGHLQKLAEHDRRTLSDFIRLQLENLVKMTKK
jgi:hypothetical protein